MPDDARQSEAIILIKAASHASAKHNELVYCAGVTPEGEWVRLYPVSFRKGADALAFKRWDRVRYSWEDNPDDPRPESRRVVPHSMQIVGELPQSERRDLITRLTSSSLKDATASGKSLALLRPHNLKFSVRRKTPDELREEQADYERIASQIGTDALKPQKPFPYKFHYAYATDEGPAEGTYQDWEMGETFSNLAESFGEAQTLARVIQVYGKQYPQKGVTFAMSRNTTSDPAWHINAVICMDEVNAPLAANLDLTV